MLKEMAQRAKKASRKLAMLSSAEKNQALRRIAAGLEEREEEVLAANKRDVNEARKAGMADHLIDRLVLTRERIAGIAADLNRVSELPDPVGVVLEKFTTDAGLKVKKVRVPLGVIAVIYESRPNVTLDVAGLALKTGNAVILRGGSETIYSNRILVTIIQDALVESGLPSGAVGLIDSPDRRYVAELLKMHEWVDMLIPRGGAALHRYCRENSTIPVITGGMGICHLFVDASADREAALDVIQNAKVQRPSVCNALDTLLVHQSLAAEFLPAVVDRLGGEGVTFRADPRALSVLKDDPQGQVKPAADEDFDTEWLSLVLSLKVVDDLQEAVEHIESHSTQHSDGILTKEKAHADYFTRVVDSACVYVNASTRFTDGSQLGLGAEVAISTQRLHARGPMALKELTTYKWVIRGENHIRG